MKRVIIALIVMSLVIPAISVVATDNPKEPFEWIEYGTYELSAKDTSKLILIVIYEDMSPSYKGWFPEFSEEWQRTEILTDINTAIDIINGESTNWNLLTRDIIVKIQGDMNRWILNLDKKDYTTWLDYALIYIDNPDEIINSSVNPYNTCCSFHQWTGCYEWIC